METRWTAVLLVVLAVAACRKTRPVDVDVTQAQDIPREIALSQLRELLPTAYYAGCTLPRERFRQRHIKEWVIDAAGVEVRPEDEDDETIRLAYARLTGARLDHRGRYFIVKLFTADQTEENTEHFAFAWREKEPAAQVLELFEALRRKN